jgi:c-di-GMP-binding flagellar brake protein YcgR
LKLLKPITGISKDNLLSRIITKGHLCCITYRSKEGWTVFKSPLTSTETSLGIQNSSAINLVTGEKVGVSFREGRTKCVFNTFVTSSMPFIRISRPNKIYQIRRRFYERSTPDCPMAAYLNVENECFQCKLLNLSLGGVSLSTYDDRVLEKGDVVQVSLVFGRNSSLNSVDGIIQQVEERGREMIIGVQFVGFEVSSGNIKKMEILIRKIKELQRKTPRKLQRN